MGCGCCALGYEFVEGVEDLVEGVGVVDGALVEVVVAEPAALGEFYGAVLGDLYVVALGEVCLGSVVVGFEVDLYELLVSAVVYLVEGGFWVFVLGVFVVEVVYDYAE